MAAGWLAARARREARLAALLTGGGGGAERNAAPAGQRRGYGGDARLPLAVMEGLGAAGSGWGVAGPGQGTSGGALRRGWRSDCKRVDR